MLVIPLVVLPVPTLSPAVDSKELAVRFLSVLILAASPLVVRLNNVSVFAPARMGIMLFVAAGIVSMLLSSKPYYSLWRSWHLLALPAMGVVLSLIPFDNRDLKKLCYIIVAAGTFAAIYGLSVYVGFDFLAPVYNLRVKQPDARNFVTSLLGNPEYFGGYLAPLSVLCFSRSFTPAVTARYRLLWMLLTLFLVGSLVLTGTRAAVIGFFAGALAVSGVEYRRATESVRSVILRLTVAIGALAVVGLVIFSTDNPVNHRNQRLAQRFVSMFDLSSTSVRERIFFYSAGTRLIAQNPVFGDGPGTFRLNFYSAIEMLNLEDDRAGVRIMTADLQNRIAEHAHNDYLEIWCDMGTVGLGALLLVIASLTVRYFRGYRHKDCRLVELSSLRSGFYGAAACLFVNALFSFPLQMPVRASLLWVLVGCFLAADEEYQRRLSA